MVHARSLLTFVFIMYLCLFHFTCGPSVRYQKENILKATVVSRSDFVVIASYYGSKFHGKKTASGEKFNMYDLTAAHKTLPFGTLLKVTNRKTNKSVVVRINDRGPFVRGRGLDLSYQAAKEIDLIRDGTGEVFVKIIKLGDEEVNENKSPNHLKN